MAIIGYYLAMDSWNEGSDFVIVVAYLIISIITLVIFKSVSGQSKPKTESATINETELNESFFIKHSWIVCLIVVALTLPCWYVLSLSQKEEVVEDVKEYTSEYTITSDPTDSINGKGYVDLGLSVKWAYHNIGAYSPSDDGDIFEWSEVFTKSQNVELDSTGKESNDDDNISRFYTALECWGGNWRLPTKDECMELIEKCEWSEGCQRRSGYKVVGPSGNSIFLPGIIFNGDFVSHMSLWSSTICENDSLNSYYLLTSEKPKVFDGAGSRAVRLVSD